ncbi:hypothetical protein ACFPM7_29200 [Actinokineospora guangxiensis]|uniref:Uncharacterized protein n=1 Tax=Actinokineospora guangxiensis TaxID=1490288 RepID=A0ABW0EV09_9PSEU
MAKDFYLDGQEFGVVTGDLRRTGSNLGDDQARLTTTLSQYTGCWGDDEIGKAFETNYWGNSEKVRLGSGTAAEGIVNTADSAKKTGEVLTSVDEETARRLDLETTAE